MCVACVVVSNAETHCLANVPGSRDDVLDTGVDKLEVANLFGERWRDGRWDTVV